MDLRQFVNRPGAATGTPTKEDRDDRAEIQAHSMVDSHGEEDDEAEDGDDCTEPYPKRSKSEKIDL